MQYGDLLDALSTYRRPGSPNFEGHFRALPTEVLDRGNTELLRQILADTALPPRARGNAAGALGQLQAQSAIPDLLAALEEPALRRCAAIALGCLGGVQGCLIGDPRTHAALARLADRDAAALWALTRLEQPARSELLVERFERGHLRHIPPQVKQLGRGQRRELALILIRRLGDLLDAGAEGDTCCWIVTALHACEEPAGVPVLRRALRSCGTGTSALRARTLRALGALAPQEAVQDLVDVALELENPGHVQLTAVCLNKILARHPRNAAVRLQPHRTSLVQLRLQWLDRAEHATRVAPERPWQRPPGSPGWLAEIRRAERALHRLIRRLSPAVTPDRDTDPR